MPSPATARLTPPKSTDEFEDIATDLLRLLWDDPYVTRVGRSGQKQHGVDAYGHIAHLGGTLGAAQFKCVEKLGVREIMGDIGAMDAGFSPTPTLYLVMTTATRDAQAQQELRDLSSKRLAQGRCKVEILFWETIANHIAGDDRLLAKYYSEWGKPSREVPKLEICAVVEGEPTTSLDLNSLAAWIQDPRLLLSPFSQELIAEKRAEGRSRDVQAMERYNEEAEALLADEERMTVLRKHLKWDRLKHCQKIGIAVSCTGQRPATDVRCVVTFPPSFEIYSAWAGAGHARVDLPERPRIFGKGPLAALDYMRWLDGKSEVQRTVESTMDYLREGSLRIHLGPQPTVQGKEIYLKLQKLQHGDQLRFTKNEDLVTIVPPEERGEHTVSWEIRADELPEPCRGSWNVTVG